MCHTKTLKHFKLIFYTICEIFNLVSIALEVGGSVEYFRLRLEITNK